MDKELKILKYPDKGLREKAIDVAPIDITSVEMQEFLGDLVQTMVKSRGVGLSATQVGDTRNVFCFISKRKAIVVLFNAKIIARSGKYRVHGEGCLSVPGIRADVKRSKYIVVTALDLKGEEMRLKFESIEAAKVQHELDHLNGMLFFDRLKGKVAMEVAEELEIYFREDK